MYYSLHHDLHWLDVTEQIQFLVATTVYIPMSAWHGSSLPGWTVHNQQLRPTTLLTVDLRHLCF